MGRSHHHRAGVAWREAALLRSDRFLSTSLVNCTSSSREQNSATYYDMKQQQAAAVLGGSRGFALFFHFFLLYTLTAAGVRTYCCFCCRPPVLHLL